MTSCQVKGQLGHTVHFRHRGSKTKSAHQVMHCLESRAITYGLVSIFQTLIHHYRNVLFMFFSTSAKVWPCISWNKFHSHFLIILQHHYSCVSSLFFSFLFPLPIMWSWSWSSLSPNYHHHTTTITRICTRIIPLELLQRTSQNCPPKLKNEDTKKKVEKWWETSWFTVTVRVQKPQFFKTSK